MNNLIKPQLKLLFIPDALVEEFKEIVFANYFVGEVFDIKSLTRNADMFSVFRKNYLETGNPYDNMDSLIFKGKGENVIINDMDELQIDIQILLNHYKMFHAAEFKRHRGLVGCKFIPSLQVW
jgi:hypothetical protein